MQSTDADMDPGSSAAATLQKNLQEAIVASVGRDPQHAPLVFQALGTLAATYAAQVRLVASVEAGREPTADDVDAWEEDFVARVRGFHRLVARALQLRGEGPTLRARGTVGFVRDQLATLPSAAALLSADVPVWDVVADTDRGGFRLIGEGECVD